MLGVGIAPAPSSARRLRRAVGLPDRDGALVRGVADGSPAAAAGIATGDLVTRIGDVEVAGPADLEAVLVAADLGRTVAVHVVRGATSST